MKDYDRLKYTLISIFLIILLVGWPIKTFSDTDRIKKDIEELASENFAGRRPGTQGIELAAKLIEQRFESLELQKVGESYRQNFSVIENKEITGSNSMSMSMIVPRRGIPKERLKPVARKLKLGKDYTPFYYSNNGTAEANLVFAGFGISMPVAGYDDYSGIDINGKIAIVLTGSPDKNTSNKYKGYSNPLYKIENAQKHGALGVILIGMKGDSANVLPPMTYMELIGTPQIPVVFAQRKFVEKFFPNSHSLITLEEKIMGTQRPASLVLEDRSAKITVNLSNRVVETSNILGMVEGTEEPDKFIVIGAHYDHLGTNALNSRQKYSYGQIHNGADDNASGTALMLELANRISENPLSKSILFIAFSSEEMGLLGSKYFTENPYVGLEDIDIMINLDMVGMLKEPLTIYGTGTATELSSLISEAASQAEIKTNNINLPHGPSDHLYFYKNNIPALHLFTGLHPHFHTPKDDIENLNYDGITKIGEFVYAFSSIISSNDLEFAYVSKEDPDMRTFGEMTLAGKSSGIYHTFHHNDKGLELLAVVRNSRAWKSGLRTGDIIIKANDKAVHSTTNLQFIVQDIMSSMNKEQLEANWFINLTILRDGEEIDIEMKI